METSNAKKNGTTSIIVICIDFNEIKIIKGFKVSRFGISQEIDEEITSMGRTDMGEGGRSEMEAEKTAVNSMS